MSVFCCTELNAIKLLYGCLIASTIESVVYDPHLPSLCQIIILVGSLKLQNPLKEVLVDTQVNTTETSMRSFTESLGTSAAYITFE